MTTGYTKDEQSLLTYFETCLVDGYGRVEGRHMNEDDIRIAKNFVKTGLIEFGRLTMATLQKLRGDPNGAIYTHWVRFSDEAWKLAHQFRRERSDRMLNKLKTKLEGEMTKNVR